MGGVSMSSTRGPDRLRIVGFCSFLVIAVATFFYSRGVIAAESSDALFPAVTVPSIAESIPKQNYPNKLSAAYIGIYAGPAISNPLGQGQIDSNTGYYDNSPQNLWNQLRLDYMVGDEGWFVGPMATFQIITSQGIQFLGQDSGARIGHKRIIHTDSLNLSADMRFFAPLKASTAIAGEVFSIQGTHNINWDIPKTRISLGLLGIHTYYFMKGNAPLSNPQDPNDPLDLQLYFGPNITYHLSDSFGVAVWGEIYPYHVLGAAWSDIRSYPADIAPGVTWDITPDVNLSPQILWYPSHPGFQGWGSIIYLSAKLM
jgi:hypothetical protein